MRIKPTLAGAAAGLVPASALAQERERPMSYFEAFGSPGREIANLTWGLLILAIAVVTIITVLVLVGLAMRARRGVDLTRDQAAVKRPDDPKSMPWIYSGLALTVLILIGFTVWTVQTLAAIQAPEKEPGLTVEFTARQWWWEARYTIGEEAFIFETANELHIPVGEPVRFRLNSGDVIHSFWVLSLGGKTDLVPGQDNVTWLEADVPGVYEGRCAEYCGLQHANMRLRVFADPPEMFARWYEKQLEPAQEPAAPEAQAGQRAFVENCAACHAVRGTVAGGEFGPDLTHLMSRTTIAAGMLPNNIGYLSGWIADPQAVKPGTKMPNLDPSGPELQAIRSYLLTLD